MAVVLSSADGEGPRAEGRIASYEDESKKRANSLGGGPLGTGAANGLEDKRRRLRGVLEKRTSAVAGGTSRIPGEFDGLDEG